MPSLAISVSRPGACAAILTSPRSPWSRLPFVSTLLSRSGPSDAYAIMTFPVTTTSPRILIADDQRDVLEAIRLLLKGEGYQSDTVESPAAALKALEERDYDVVLIDLNYARDTT